MESSCRDIPAPGVGAECGPCPAGFTGNGIKCLGNVKCRLKCNVKPNLALALIDHCCMNQHIIKQNVCDVFIVSVNFDDCVCMVFYTLL